MKFPFIVHPDTQRPDPMLTLSVITVVACVLRFLFDGLSIDVHGHALLIGHVDSLTYGSLLTPVLGAHGYVHVRSVRNNASMKVDDPDA